MKKGFTMIELLAVFMLLGIILLITLPQITSLLKKENNESYEGFKKDIYVATEAYVTDKKISIANSSSYTVYLKDVINSGYIKSSLINPKTNEKVSEDLTSKIIVKKNSDGILSYEFIES